MTIKITTPGLVPAYRMGQETERAVNPKVNRTADQGNDAFEVDLSPEAQEKRAEESQNSGKGTTMLDVAIEKLKMQIEVTKEQLAQLENVEGKAAEAQRQALTELLAGLGMKLMDLMLKKLELEGGGG